MREILLATAIAAFVLIVQVSARMLVSPSWLVAGLIAITIGLSVSVPAAIVYHVLLHSALSKRGALDAGWLWHPTRLHARLLEHERGTVLIWFGVGVTGWVITLLGCAAVAAAVWL